MLDTRDNTPDIDKGTVDASDSPKLLWKTCSKCKAVYKAKHATSKHGCTICLNCFIYKELSSMHGKVAKVGIKGQDGFVCQRCYQSVSHLRSILYTIVLRGSSY